MRTQRGRPLATGRKRDPRGPALVLLLATSAGSTCLLLGGLLGGEGSAPRAPLDHNVRSVERQLGPGAARTRARMGETLVYDADSPAGIEALARFCDTAGAEDGPALRRVALAERDPVCAGNAIRALGRLRAVAGDVDLLRLLHDGRENVRDQVIVALGQSGRAETIDVLEPFLRAPDAKTRILAGQAVGDLGGSKADAILKALLDERTAVRGRAAAAAREP